MLPLSSDSSMEEQSYVNVSTRKKTEKRMDVYFILGGAAIHIIFFSAKDLFPFLQDHLCFFKSMYFLVILCV